MRSLAYRLIACLCLLTLPLAAMAQTVIAPAAITTPAVDDAAAIQAVFDSGEKHVKLTAAAYNWGSCLVVPKDASLEAPGIYLTRLNLSANVDCMIELKWGARLKGLYLNGGGTYTGRGVVIRYGQHYQRIEDIGGWTSGYVIEFEATGAGTNAQILGASIGRYDCSAWSMRILGDYNVQDGVRQIRRLFTGGCQGPDLGASFATLLEHSNVVGIRTEMGSKYLRILNNRIAAAVDLRGQNQTYMHNTTAGVFQIWPGSCGNYVVGTMHMSGVTDLNAGACSNAIW